MLDDLKEKAGANIVCPSFHKEVGKMCSVFLDIEINIKNKYKQIISLFISLLNACDQFFEQLQHSIQMQTGIRKKILKLDILANLWGHCSLNTGVKMHRYTLTTSQFPESVQY